MVKISPTGRVVALAVNCNSAVCTRILFMDMLNEVSVSSPVYPKSNEDMTGRTFWVTSLEWSGDGLLLAAMTRRGCLLLLPRFGPPLRLIASGCGLEMGPAYFLPLHPLITVQNKSGLNVTDHETSDSSERDPQRQRFSVATHPSLPVVLCSDGYCLTVLRLPPASCSLPRLVCSLVNTGRGVLGLPQIRALAGLQLREVVEKEGAVVHDESVRVSCQSLTQAGSDYSPVAGKASFGDIDAGMDGSHRLANTCDWESKSERGKVFQAHLQAAWGLLLSAGDYDPGNGTYPRYLSPQEVGLLSSEVQIARDVTVTALASSLAEPHSGQEHVLSTLSMGFLDQFDQRCHKVVYKVSNTYLMSLLSKLLEKHTSFASTSNHTVDSVEVYAQHITSSTRELWKIFQETMMLVAEIYCHTPV
jgi:hypothetical protein